MVRDWPIVVPGLARGQRAVGTDTGGGRVVPARTVVVLRDVEELEDAVRAVVETTGVFTVVDSLVVVTGVLLLVRVVDIAVVAA